MLESAHLLRAFFFASLSALFSRLHHRHWRRVNLAAQGLLHLFFASINQDSWQEQRMTYRVFEKVNILGDARVVVGCLLLVGQLVHWGKKRYWVPGGEESQQVRRQELRHTDALVTSV